MTLETWLQATMRVLGVSSGSSVDKERTGSSPSDAGGLHHFIAMFKSFARATQAAALASWQRLETIISQSALRWGLSAWPSARRRKVVD